MNGSFLALSIIILGILSKVTHGEMSEYGCFAKSSVQSLYTFDDSYTYQSSGHCTEKCSSDGVAALIDGGDCWCGSEVPPSSLQVDSSFCDTPCQGYNKENCGGQDYFLIYADSGAQTAVLSSSSSSRLSSTATSRSSTSSKLSSSSSSSATSSSETSPSASSSSLSETSSSSSLSSSSSSSSSSNSRSPLYITYVSTVTASAGSQSASVVEITETVHPSSASDSAESSNTATSKGQSKSKKLSGGAIAGIVIGAVLGAGLLIGLVLFFLWWRRKHSDDNDSDFDTVLYNEKMDGAAGGATRSNHPYNAFNAPRNNLDNDYQINPNPFLNNLTAGATAAAGLGMAVGQKLDSIGRSGTSNTNRSAYHSTSKHSLSNGGNSSILNEEFLFDSAGVSPGYLDPSLMPPDAEYGRRRLSNGSLPDLATNGGLKVVN